MSPKKPAAPKPPFISGFCNPTIPRTTAYDPHQKCHGCDCRAPRCPCTPDAGDLDGGPAVPLTDVDLATVLDMLTAVAEHADKAALGDGVTALGWEDAVRLLDRLRAAGDHLRAVDAALVAHVYLKGEHGKTTVDQVGPVEVARTRDRKQWDERGVARAVVDHRMMAWDAGTGEFPDPFEVVEWLLEVVHVDYARVTALRALGLEPKAFCEDLPGNPVVRLPPRNRLG